MKFKRGLGITLVLLSFILIMSNVKMVGYFAGNGNQLGLFNIIPITLFLSGMTLFFLSGLEQKVDLESASEQESKSKSFFKKAKKNIEYATVNVPANVLAATGAMEGIQYISEHGATGYQTGLAGAAAMSSIYAVNKTGLVNKAVKGAYKMVGKVNEKVRPWARAATVGAYLTAATMSGINTGQNITKDFSKKGEIAPVHTEESWLPMPNNDLIEGEPLVSRHRIKGKFQRTYRWDELFDKTEAKYKIKKGLLAGLCMREGYGNPLQLNSGGDGGAGMIQMQPGMAQHYGLKTFGTSTRLGADKKHGQKLKEFLDSIDYDYEKAAKVDDRFNPKKNIDAAGQMISDYHKKYGNWDKAISAYNVGQKRSSRVPVKTSHVRHVDDYIDYYNAHDKVDHLKK